MVKNIVALAALLAFELVIDGVLPGVFGEGFNPALVGAYLAAQGVVVCYA